MTKKSETEDKNQQKYFKLMFGTEYPSLDKVEAALEKAHEIRQFEIRLYWQRSLFYWGFVLTLFAGLSLITTSEEFIKVISSDKNESSNTILLMMAFGISLLGSFVSYAWRYIEKSSHAWQQNWELHIDFLEDDVTGRLYKTPLGKRDDFFSVSKITKTVITAFTIFWALANIVIATYLFPELYQSIQPFFVLFSIPFFVLFLIPFVVLFFMPFGDLKNYWRTSFTASPLGDNKDGTKDELFRREFPELIFPKEIK